MAVLKSQVQGLSQINDVLSKLPDRIQRNTLQRATRAGGKVILDATKAAAPSGWAGDSLKGQSPSSKKYGTLKMNLAIQAMGKLRNTARGVRIWTRNAFWANFFEFGTSRQPARPFMRPAFDASAGEAVAKMRETLAQGVEDEANKLAGPYATAKKSFGVR